MFETSAHLISKQRAFFNAGATQSSEWRVEALRQLKKAILAHKEKIIAALFQDLKKPALSAQKVEIDQIIAEIDEHIHSLNQWTTPQRVKTPLIFFPTKSSIVPQPRGVVLIISPWNFPFALTFRPLIGAISAGNCAILKPSELSPHSSRIIAQIISSIFDPNYVAVIQGDAYVAQEILTHAFDYIFFTGSTRVGKLVMQAAASHLTPLTLELGGCNPCIVDHNVDIRVATRRIAWGKFYNSGQSCLAPNYVAVHENIKKDFTEQLLQAIKEIYRDSTKIGAIINQFHFDRLTKLLKNRNVLYGGNFDRSQLYIEPTVIETNENDPLLQEELFGPILPLISYETVDTVVKNIHEHPLALYLFSNNATLQQKITEQTISGGLCINDVAVHYANSNLPFGGVGKSGFGSYHGKKTFDIFSHYKSVMKRSFWFDWSLRYRF